MSQLLRGKVCVVTGSSAGIGRAAAEAILQAGGSLTLNCRSRDRAAAAAKELDPSGRRTLAVGADVSIEAEVLTLFGEVIDRFGRVDVLVNNAGAYLSSEIDDMPLGDWKRILETNLTAPFLCARSAARIMKEQRSGAIINVTSISGRIGARGSGAYAASKHGLEGLNKVLAVELGPYGIRSVAVAPGFTGSSMPQEHDSAESASLSDQARAAPGWREVLNRRRNPLGRIAECEEVANVIVFLASEAASYVNGVSVMVDGGLLCNPTGP